MWFSLILVATYLSTSGTVGHGAPSTRRTGANGICTIYLNQNLTSAFCKMTCVSIPDGTLVGFSLRDFLTENFTKFSGDGDTDFQWSPCAPLDIEGSMPCSESENAAMCTQSSATGEWSPIAQLTPYNSSLHTDNMNDGLAFSIQYQHEAVKAEIDFYCRRDSTPGTITEVPSKQGTKFHYKFVVTSSYACPTAVTPIHGPTTQPQTSTLSAGTIVIICLIGAFLLYLLIGVTYKSAAKGASGMERMPNHDLWTKLFSSVRSGVFWLCSPCYKGDSVDAAQYKPL